MKLRAISYLIFLVGLTDAPAWAINGGTLRINPQNGWRAFEVISVGEDPAGDGYTYPMPGSFDGLGVWAPDAASLRVNINHELADAAVSELNLNLANFQTAIRNVISSGSTGGVTFVTSAQQAYGRWTANGGSTWTATSSNATTIFDHFCSSQSYKPDTFGAGRGFVDNIYITGEETFDTTGRLFAIDLANRDYYQLSGVTGSASGGIGGMPSDSFENAALLDTGDTSHVALLLSPDGGSSTMRLYIGDKGKDATGAASNSFLARNGLAYGRYYYLNGSFPATTGSSPTSGIFSTSAVGALSIAKLEDVDANPNNGTQAVQGIQETGLFQYDFNLVFSGGTFSTGLSSFSLKKLQEQHDNTDGQIGDTDNVDWTAATTLNNVSYPNGIIFVNEDSFTSPKANGETWMVTLTPGSTPTLIANDTLIAGTTESTGILDISSLVGFKPGSILLTDVQGSSSSLSVLINPYASLAGDFNGSGGVNAADYVSWRMGEGTTYSPDDYYTWREQFGQTPGSLTAGAGEVLGGAQAVPEPAGVVLAIAAAGLALCCGVFRSRRLAKPQAEIGRLHS
jgi:hypothetical protein